VIPEREADQEEHHYAEKRVAEGPKLNRLGCSSALAKQAV
jgi:hypothetical protein